MPAQEKSNPWTGGFLDQAPDEVRRALRATDAERAAATHATQILMARCDGRDERGVRYCFGWALHAAFLAGVRWRERQG